MICHQVRKCSGTTHHSPVMAPYTQAFNFFWHTPPQVPPSPPQLWYLICLALRGVQTSQLGDFLSWWLNDASAWPRTRRRRCCPGARRTRMSVAATAYTFDQKESKGQSVGVLLFLGEKRNHQRKSCIPTLAAPQSKLRIMWDLWTLNGRLSQCPCWWYSSPLLKITRPNSMILGTQGGENAANTQEKS